MTALTPARPPFIGVALERLLVHRAPEGWLEEALAGIGGGVAELRFSNRGCDANGNPQAASPMKTSTVENASRAAYETVDDCAAGLARFIDACDHRPVIAKRCFRPRPVDGGNARARLRDVARECPTERAHS